jgi:IS30 family transposase
MPKKVVTEQDEKKIIDLILVYEVPVKHVARRLGLARNTITTVMNRNNYSWCQARKQWVKE